MTADTRLSSPDEPETILGPWGVLDQASAVQTPLRDPMRAYLDGLTSAASQASARARLRAVARLVAVPAYEALLWGQLRSHHVAFIRSKLVTAEAAPATVNLTLAVLRGIARQARDFNLMTDEEYRRITEVKPHKGLRLPPGRHVRSGELTALVEACARDKTPAGARDAAMLACLYVGDLRRAELAALKVEHCGRLAAGPGRAARPALPAGQQGRPHPGRGHHRRRRLQRTGQARGRGEDRARVAP